MTVSNQTCMVLSGRNVLGCSRELDVQGATAGNWNKRSTATMHAHSRTVKTSGKKSITLIEVIVAMVVLSIMAAVVVPTQNAFAEKASQNTALSQAAAVRTSLQAIASESFSTQASDLPAEINGATPLDQITGYAPASTKMGATVGDEIRLLSGAQTPATDASLVSASYSGKTLTGFVLKLDNYTVSFGNDLYTIEKNAS